MCIINVPMAFWEVLTGIFDVAAKLTLSCGKNVKKEKHLKRNVDKI